MKQKQYIKKLRELRISLGLTMPEFAKEINVSYEDVQRWEYGSLLPTKEQLDGIRERFNVDVSEFYEAPKKSKKTRRDFKAITIDIYYPILGFILSLGIVQFYLFLENFYIKAFFAVVTTLVIFFLVKVIKLKKKFRTFIISMIVIIIGVITFNNSNSFYYQLDNPPRYIITDHIQTNFIYDHNRIDSFEFEIDDHYYGLIYNIGFDNIYIYDLHADNEHMEIIINTENRPVSDVIVLEDKLYYSSYETYQPYFESFTGSYDLYEIDLNDYSETLVLSTDKPYQMFKSDDDLYFYNLPYRTYQTGNSSIYEIDQNMITLVKELEFEIKDIVFSGFEYTVSTYTSLREPMICFMDRDFILRNELFLDYEEYPYQFVEYNGEVFTTVYGELVILNGSFVIESGLRDIELDFLNFANDKYFFGGKIYDRGFDIVDDDYAYHSNYQYEGAAAVFGLRDRGQEEILLVDFYTVSYVARAQYYSVRSDQVISSTYRAILLYTSIPLLTFMSVFSMRRKKHQR